MKKIKLDHLGQYYAAISGVESPGTFAVQACLAEDLDGYVLYKAVQDIVGRLPHFNVRQHNGFMHYYNQLLDEDVDLEWEEENTQPCRYFPEGDRLFRVVCGRRHFRLEVLHSVCDGRSLAYVACSLLIRYFELMGVSVNKKGFIDCDGKGCTEEAEDAYARHADMRKTEYEKPMDVYVPKYKPASAQFITHKFDLEKLKAGASAQEFTISEHIMEFIFGALDRQRQIDGCNKPITINVPIDCRGFFSSKSLRNFVTHKIVDSPACLRGVTEGYVQGKISEMERWIRFGGIVPLFIKKPIIRSVGNSATAGCSTAFSNLGLLKLPAEIACKVLDFAFMLGAEKMPYQFACVTFGNVLNLTATVTVQNTEILDKIVNDLNNAPL
ncbi:MAG: hypothetical protein FWE21_06000 [Defluviitaleaceae bacterium]|nr:hypothetical protein [Defluviitaleaceae bacterium]